MKELLDFIKQLSLADPKTASQKAAKAAEELGTLASHVLAFESLGGNRHRIVPQEVLVEDVADLCLCALSVGYQVGMTHEALLAAMKRKALYWGSLQENESVLPANGMIPYEFHITVDADREDFKTTAFIGDCAALGVKPLVIGLTENDLTGDLRHVMTSSTILGNNTDAMAHLRWLSAKLTERGYHVIREKIETVPWHPAAASDRASYLESHTKVVVNTQDPAALRWKIALVCDKHGAHLSKNDLKSAGSLLPRTFMCTLRFSSQQLVQCDRHWSDTLRKEAAESLGLSLDDFHQFSRLSKPIQVFEVFNNLFRAELAKVADINLEKPIVEFALYDSSRSLDDGWILSRPLSTIDRPKLRCSLCGTEDGVKETHEGPRCRSSVCAPY